MRIVGAAAWFLPFVLCASAAAQHNVLLIVGDDIGVDRIGAYHVVPDPGHTPRIDALAAQGVLFRNAYADPVCSPSRVTILTGKYGFRTGMGLAMNYVTDTFEISPSEVCLPAAIKPRYHSSVCGKWHMAAEQVSGLMHPLLVGFEHHFGTITVLDGFIGDEYYMFPKNIDGTEVLSTVYNTTDVVNDTLGQIARAGSAPWCIWATFVAPHAPYHKPPQNLHTYNLPGPIAPNIPIHMKAMAEAMDTEIGRLLDSMDPAVLANTIVMFIGDNGTDKPATTPPYDPNKMKGTVYEGGVHVPLIICGPGVAAGAECTALVNSTDLYATITDIAGEPHTAATDSVSLLPYFKDPAQTSLRNFAYTEIFQPNGFGPYTSRHRSARGSRYKLIWNYTLSDSPNSQEFYDLLNDPLETVNLLPSPPLATDAQSAFDALTAVLKEQKLPWASQGNALAGAGGEPALSGTGTMLPGAPVTLSLTNARPNAAVAMVIGTSYILKSFKTGVLVPAPAFVITGLLTDATGSLVLGSNWPASMPGNLDIYYQDWIVDPSGPVGYAASNGLHSASP